MRRCGTQRRERDAPCSMTRSSRRASLGNAGPQSSGRPRRRASQGTSAVVGAQEAIEDAEGRETSNPRSASLDHAGHHRDALSQPSDLPEDVLDAAAQLCAVVSLCRPSGCVSMRSRVTEHLFEPRASARSVPRRLFGGKIGHLQRALDAIEARLKTSRSTRFDASVGSGLR